LKRFDLGRLLARELGGDFIVVPNPDHPELIAGPDVLIGGRGRITATFRVARSTNRSLLEARVVATRLALPAGTNLVGMVEDDTEPPPQLVQQGFDVVLRDAESPRLVRLCSAPPSERLRIKELQGVQRRHALFYSTILQISELRQRRELKATSAREVVTSLQSRQPLVDDQLAKLAAPPVFAEPSTTSPQKWRKRRSDVLSSRASVRQTTVAALPDVHRSIAQRLKPLWSEALADDFVLDTGVPYQRTFQPRVLLVEAWPTYRFDPRKPARAAAFSSWLMALATTPEDIETLVNRSLEAVSKRIHA
jgi:hypothetical protein